MIALQGKHKRILLIAGAVVVVVVAVVLTGGESEYTPFTEEDRTVDGIIITGDTRPASLEAVAARLDEFTRRLEALDQENAQLREARARDLEATVERLMAETASRNSEEAANARVALDELRAEMEALGLRLPAIPAATPQDHAVAEALRAAGKEPPPTPAQALEDAAPLVVSPPDADPVSLALPPGDDAARAPAPQAAPVIVEERRLTDGEIRALFASRARGGTAATMIADGAGPGPSAFKGEPPVVRMITSLDVAEVERPSRVGGREVFLPAGSIFSGVLLTGIDAPGGSAAQANPMPVLLRLKHEAILPNRFAANVRECFVLLASFGDLSSERAQMRGEAVSCILRDGTVIQRELKAYAVGEDGKAGVRGRVVTRQGAFIARAILVGILDGVAQAFNDSTTISVGASGSGGGGDPIVSGFAGGFGSAFERIADWYLEQAEQLFPVIEIDNGRSIDVVLTQGLEFRTDL
jgi:conjugal transfer pilus assembly protein TraB